MLAFLHFNKHLTKHITIISDREYSFYEDFGCLVRQAKEKSLIKWLQQSNILITGTSYPANLELELIKIAQEIGVFSISFVEHWTNFGARFERNFDRITPDVICVTDERARNLAIQEGISEQCIVVLKNPYHHFLEKWMPTVSKEKLLEPFALDHTKPYLLYVPEPLSKFGLRTKYGFDETDGLRLLLRAIEMLETKNVVLIIKAHPNHDPGTFQDLANLSKFKNIIYLNDGNLNLLLYYSSIVIGHFSNALVEANIMSKPIIRIVPNSNRIYADPLDLNNVTIKRNPEEIVAAIDLKLNSNLNSKQEAFLKNV